MKILIALFLCFAAVTLSAQQLNIPKDKQFQITTRGVNTSPNLQDEQSVYSFRSLGKNQEGNTIFECKLTTAILKRGVGLIEWLNTDSIRKTDLSYSGSLFPMAILQQPFTVVVSPKGKLVSIDGVQPILKVAFKNWNLAETIENQIIEDSKTNLSSTIQSFFLQIPAQKIVLSTEWKDKSSGYNLKVTGIKGHLITISSTPKNADDIKVTHKYLYNSLTGLIESSTINNEGTIEIGTSSGLKKVPLHYVASQKSGKTVQKAKPDTAWINMAVRLSYWSNNLKTNLEYDSAKVYHEFRTYDATYGKDPYYMLNKLNIFQGMRTNYSHAIYDSLLLTIPNKYIAGRQDHLYNKMGNVMDHQTATLAYAVSKYFYKEKMFGEYLQTTLSQDFISGRAEVLKQKSYELLHLFMKDKDIVYQQKVRPLYLWANAKKDPNDLNYLLNAADQFNKMNDNEVKSGNGGRYALLIYKMLVEAKQQQVADTLLSKTISNLHKYTADTLNQDRYAAQNLLAYAYYLKYEISLASDTVKAFQYLSKASLYSPKNNTEKQYSSFYDRVFLNSKESYRQDFIESLLKHGNQQQALKLFAEQINAEPESIVQMKSIYESNFNNKSFSNFFREDVIGLWEQAPDFNVKEIAGAAHSLTDFKNKWLVLDFWGTWCGPCREEMPQVNNFNNEITAGKLNGITFLSIACNDTEEKVKTYLHANNFSIPVAISNGTMENIYKIRGYPSKILISPDGKMLNVKFGKDWNNIIRQFNQIYATN